MLRDYFNVFFFFKAIDFFKKDIKKNSNLYLEFYLILISFVLYEGLSLKL